MAWGKKKKKKKRERKTFHIPYFTIVFLSKLPIAVILQSIYDWHHFIKGFHMFPLHKSHINRAFFLCFFLALVTDPQDHPYSNDKKCAHGNVTVMYFFQLV